MSHEELGCTGLENDGAQGASTLFSKVKGLHSPGLSCQIQFHYVENPVVTLTAIEHGVTAGSRENVLDVKMQMGAEFQSKSKVIAKLRETPEFSVGLLPAANNRIRFKFNICRVVLHDPIEVSGIPGSNPPFREHTHFKYRMRHATRAVESTQSFRAELETS